MLRTQEDTPISWVTLDCAVTVQIVMHVNSNKVYLLIYTYENSMFQENWARNELLVFRTKFWGGRTIKINFANR